MCVLWREVKAAFLVVYLPADGDSKGMKPTLVVMAAGMGSRFGGLKQVEPVGPNGETILEYSVYDAIRAGFGKVVFIIKEEIRDVFEEKVLSRLPALFPHALAFQELQELPDGFSVPEGRSKPWGTGHAIWCARHVVKEPFAVLNADDFYGASSFETIAKHLSHLPHHPHAGDNPEFALVGYRLGRTLSRHGTVSRGICRMDEEGYLLSVQELTKLSQDSATGRVRDEIVTDEDFELSQLVSMNFWGFTPALFPELERLFTDFLKAEIETPKSEFYIPKAVATLLEEKSAKVKMLPTESPWAGVTYQEDKPELVELIKKLTDKGAYPTPLWV